MVTVVKKREGNIAVNIIAKLQNKGKGMSTDQLAEALGLPIEKVRSAITRERTANRIAAIGERMHRRYVLPQFASTEELGGERRAARALLNTPHSAPAETPKVHSNNGRSQIRLTDAEYDHLANEIFPHWLKAPFGIISSETIEEAMNTLPVHRRRAKIKHLSSLPIVIKKMQTKLMELIDKPGEEKIVEVPVEVEKKIDIDKVLNEAAFDKLTSVYFQRYSKQQEAAALLVAEQSAEMVATMRHNNALITELISKITGVKSRAIAEVHSSFVMTPTRVAPRVVVIGVKGQQETHIRQTLGAHAVDIVKCVESVSHLKIPPSCQYVLLNTKHGAHIMTNQAKSTLPAGCEIIECHGTTRITDALRLIAVRNPSEAELVSFR